MFEAASDYPVAGVMWSMMIFFLWIIWLMLLFASFGNLFRRTDISGWGKAGWTLCFLVLPYVGVLIYLITQIRPLSEGGPPVFSGAQGSRETQIPAMISHGGY